MAYRAAFYWALFSGLALPAQSQPLESYYRVDLRLVQVHAAFRNEQGVYLDKLSKDQIRIFEDGKPQPIVSFEPPDTRLSCGILLDSTGSMETALPVVKQAVLRFIDLLRDRDRVAIYSFNLILWPVQEFTVNKYAAKAALMGIEATGQTALFDAIAGFADVMSTQPGKKAIIVFTDGMDNHSIITSRAASEWARKVGAPIYTVAQGAAVDDKRLILQLGRLARSSGGIPYTARKPSDVEKVFRNIAADLKHDYQLTYKPPESQNKRWRKIQLSVQHPGPVKIIARAGYYPD